MGMNLGFMWRRDGDKTEKVGLYEYATKKEESDEICFLEESWRSKGNIYTKLIGVAEENHSFWNLGICHLSWYGHF